MSRRTGEALVLALALLALVPSRAGAGDVRVEASADRTELVLGEVLHLTVEVEADEAPDAIELRDAQSLPFDVVSRSRSSGTSLSLGGGAGVRLRRTVVWTLDLAPKRPGELVVPPVVAVVKGVRHETAPIAVRVTAARPPGPAAPPDRGGGWRGWERDLALEVEVDRREAFLGEQITASVWILSPVGVVSYEAYRPPPYDGFWVEELETPQRLAWRLRSVGGVPTRAYLVQRLALFPTRAGTATLGPYRLDVAVRVGRASRFGPLDDLRRVERRSKPVELRVKPLPAGAPAGFEGVNVGSWKLEVKGPEGGAVAGEAVAIRVSAAGEGNVRALSLPRLPELAGARAFEPTSSEQVRARSGRLGGARTLETVIVPERPGTVSVPSLAWPTFDPRRGVYEIARTPALEIPVRPGAARAPAPAADALAAGLRPIRTGEVPAPHGPPPWRTTPFLALLVAPPLAYAVLAVRDALRRRALAGAPARRARAAGRVARRRLDRAARRLAAGDPDAFLAEAERALVAYASDRLGRPASGMTRAALAAALAEAGARPRAIAALGAARDALDAARFGGGAAPDEVRHLAGRALALLEEDDGRVGEGEAP